MYEELKATEEERLRAEIQEKTRLELRKISIKHSLLGHVKQMDTIKKGAQSIFSETTANFLEP